MTGSMREHYYENGDQDPRGNGDRPGGGHHDSEIQATCPFCDESVSRLPDHLPCTGATGPDRGESA